MGKNFRILFSLVVILLVLAAGFYLLGKSRSMVMNAPAGGAASSLEGCYVSHIGKNIHTLYIEREEGGSVTGMLAYNNYQMDSSSGPFAATFADGILVGNYSFESEGMRSERQVIFKQVGDSFIPGYGDIAAPGYDPKSTFVKDADCVEHFTDADNTIAFDHHPLFKVVWGNILPTTEWRLDTGVSVSARPAGTPLGVVLASVIIPRAYLPGTNFSGARLSIGRSSDPSAIGSCRAVGVPAENLGEVTIGGFPFGKFSFSDAGAGNFYETTSYRGIVDGDCYTVEYTIHSTNIGNYPPEQGIKEFDKAKVESELEKTVNSLAFLVNSD